MKAKELADRVGVSLPTLRKIERGAPTVQIGHLARTLEVFGMLDGLHRLASLANDEVGQDLENQRLPQRIR